MVENFVYTRGGESYPPIADLRDPKWAMTDRERPIFREGHAGDTSTVLGHVGSYDRYYWGSDSDSSHVGTAASDGSRAHAVKLESVWAVRHTEQMHSGREGDYKHADNPPVDVAARDALKAQAPGAAARQTMEDVQKMPPGERGGFKRSDSVEGSAHDASNARVKEQARESISDALNVRGKEWVREPTSKGMEEKYGQGRRVLDSVVQRI